MKVTNCIECPKCRKPFLKKNTTPYAGNSNLDVGREGYCHKCHTYFGTWELVNIWGLDAGDLYGEIRNVKQWINSLVEKFPYYQSYFVEPEPEWATEYERKDSYQIVSRMLLGISEIDDYTDVMSTYADALDIGVQ